MANYPPRHRKPKRQSMPFEARLRIFCTVGALIVMGLCAAILALLHVTLGPMLATLGILVLILLLVFAAFIEEAIRPIQTLANVVAALREEDYSFRARGANRDDSVGQLSLEINALADTLQAQRVGALEAVALLRRVIAEMDAPVLAFDQETRLRLLNPAAERAFSIEPAKHLGKTATELNLTGLLDEPSETVVQLDTQGPATPGLRRLEPSQPARWMIRRGAFRQRGVPHTLVVLSDVSAALREEERLAWRRLIRVIGHEISNSLTPIKSIAGSLRSRILPATPRPPITLPGTVDALPGSRDSLNQPSLPLPPQAASLQRDLQRGLSVIENRAESLNRFVQAYRQLAQLPAPVLKRVPLQALLERVVSLEIRLDVRLIAAPDVELLADEDQIEQLLINLVRNAVESALSCVDEAPDQPTSLSPADTSLSDLRREAAKVSDGNATLAEAKRSSVPVGVRTAEVRPSDLAFSRATEPCEPGVTIRATDDGDLVSIAIEDNGPGLANPENLFVPLYTTKKSGSGVGLALARQIVEAHGGVIDLRNKPNHQGCIAEVRIPIAERLKI
jgi:nitrogen fixation/metabolism regulation signal transduction histidine kinase